MAETSLFPHQTTSTSSPETLDTLTTRSTRRLDGMKVDNMKRLVDRFVIPGIHRVIVPASGRLSNLCRATGILLDRTCESREIQLDLQVTYLRRVLHFCFYSDLLFDDEGLSVGSGIRVFIAEGDHKVSRRLRSTPRYFKGPHQHLQFSPHEEVEERCVRWQRRTSHSEIDLAFSKRLEGMKATTSSLRRTFRRPCCSSTYQVLAQHDFFRCWKETKACKTDLYLLPKQLDEKVARLHLPVHGATLTVLTQEHRLFGRLG